ncbi:MAG: alpha/beta fold hydrolase [Ardenticatenaceae bacterium]
MKAVINGIQMYYEVHGAGSPVLFVHGFPFSGKLWQPLVEPMRDDYRLITPDLRGFGRSEASEETSMGQYADDLAALLDAIGERSAVTLVGLSMGGYVLFEFYRRYPERVHALVLADTRSQADTEEGRQNRFKLAARVRKEGSKVVADNMIGQLFAPHASEALRSQWREVMSTTSPAGVIAALHAMAARLDSTDLLESLNRPTLIVVGEEDPITPVADARKMQEAIAGAELEIIPAAAHMTPVEQPARFVAILEQFLDDLDPVDRQGWPKRV